MAENAVFLSYTDPSQIQKTIESGNLASFLDEMHIARAEELKAALLAALQSGSGKRSHFYMNYRCRDYASPAFRAEAFLPVFGVKEQTPGITRKSIFAEIFAVKEDVIDGDGFRKQIFDGRYEYAGTFSAMTDAEIRNAVNALPGAENAAAETETDGSRSDQLSGAARIATAVWNALEQNPRTRIVIRMENAKEGSREVLAPLYELFPELLRRQLGFMTNVAEEDLAAIAAHKLPVYILTADAEEAIEPSKFPFPVIFCDAETSEEDNQVVTGREAALHMLAEEIVCAGRDGLDEAETAVLAEHGTEIPSFRYFEEILQHLFEGKFDDTPDEEEMLPDEDEQPDAEELRGPQATEENITEENTMGREKDSIAGGILTAAEEARLAAEAAKAAAEERAERAEALQEAQRAYAETPEDVREVIEEEWIEISDEPEEYEEIIDTDAVEIDEPEAEEIIDSDAVEVDEPEDSDGFESEEFDGSEEIDDSEADEFDEAEEIIDLEESPDLEETGEETAAEVTADEIGTEKEIPAKKPETVESLREEVDSYKKKNKALVKKMKDLRKVCAILGGVAAVLLIACLVLGGMLIARRNKKVDGPSDSVITAAESTTEAETVPGTADSEAVASEATTENANAGENSEAAPETESESGTTENAESSAESTAAGENTEGPVESTDNAAANANRSGSDLDVLQGDSTATGIYYADKYERLGGNSSYDVYYHIMFAENAEGEGISEDDSLPYAGCYVNSREEDKADLKYFNFTWTKMDEASPTEGIKATWYDNKNIEYYLHIAYASDETGADFSTDDAAGRAYIGYYIDKFKEDSTNPEDFSWIAR